MLILLIVRNEKLQSEGFFNGIISIQSFVKVDQLVKKVGMGTCRKEYSIISYTKCTRELITRYQM